MVGVTTAVGVEALGLNPDDVAVAVLNLCCELTAAVTVGVPALVADVPGVDSLAVATEPGAVGRTPSEGIEGRTAPEIGEDNNGIRACAEVPTTLILTPLEATGDAVVLGGRNSGDASLCPDVAVTLGLLALMPVGVETLVPVAADVTAVLGVSMLEGAANRGADVLATTGVVALALTVLNPVAGLVVLGQLVEAAVLNPVVGVPVLGPVNEVPILDSVVGVTLLGPGAAALALGPVAGVQLSAGETEYLDPVIAALDVVVRPP